MMQQIVAVRDSAVDAFMRPMFVPAIPAAVRAFKDEVNRAGSEMGAHAEDYELYHIGSFDDSTGVIVHMASHVLIVRAKDVKEVRDVQK